jgi:hypothetical protein
MICVGTHGEVMITQSPLTGYRQRAQIGSTALDCRILGALWYKKQGDMAKESQNSHFYPSSILC